MRCAFLPGTSVPSVSIWCEMQRRRQAILSVAAPVAALIALAAAFSWRVTPSTTPGPAPAASASSTTPQPTGAELFARYCAACHAADSLTAALRAASDREATRQEWGALLTHHGAASDAPVG